MDLNNYLQDISEISGYLWQRGWAEGNAGNISFNISEIIDSDRLDVKSLPVFKLNKKLNSLKGAYIWVTGAGVRMRDLSKDTANLSLIVNILNNGLSYRVIKFSDYQGKSGKSVPVLLPDIKPTSELPAHLAIHNYIKENNLKEKIILHTHPTELIALSQIKGLKSEKIINNIIWGMHPENRIVLPGGIGLVPYTLPGSDKIAGLTIKAFEKHKVVIWEKHGCIAIGENFSTVFDIIDTLTKSVKIFFMCRSAGYNAEGLSRKQISELCKHFPA